MESITISVYSNTTGHPVFVGNPVVSDQMWELFERALEEVAEK